MNNFENIYKLEKLRLVALLLAFCMSILSQLPLFRIVLGINTQLLIYPFWALLIFFTLFKRDELSTKFLTTTVLPYLIFVFVLLVYQVLIANKYVTADLSIQIYASLVITYLGYANLDVLEKYFSLVVTAVALCCFILAVDIYIEYFRNYSFQEIDYIFRSKNSAAFILLIGLMMMFVDFSKKSIFIKIVRLIFSAVFIYLCLLMRSRAVLLSIIIFVFFSLFMSKISRKLKVIWLVAIITIAILIVAVPDWNELIIQNILLNGKSGGSLDEISSNRLQYFDDFKLFSDKLLFGVGNYYMDNFYLESIINYGWPLGLLVLTLALLPSRMLFFRGEKTNMKRFLVLLVIVHLFNAAFEGLPPFGPGAKCFTLWIFYGAWQKYRERENVDGLK